MFFKCMLIIFVIGANYCHGRPPDTGWSDDDGTTYYYDYFDEFNDTDYYDYNDEFNATDYSDNHGDFNEEPPTIPAIQPTVRPDLPLPPIPTERTYVIQPTGQSDDDEATSFDDYEERELHSIQDSNLRETYFEFEVQYAAEKDYYDDIPIVDPRLRPIPISRVHYPPEPDQDSNLRETYIPIEGQAPTNVKRISYKWKFPHALTNKEGEHVFREVNAEKRQQIIDKSPECSGLPHYNYNISNKLIIFSNYNPNRLIEYGEDDDMLICIKSLFRNIFMNRLSSLDPSFNATNVSEMSQQHPCVDLYRTHEVQIKHAAFAKITSVYLFRDRGVSTTDNLISKCSDTLYNPSNHSKMNFIYELFPTIPWSCDSLSFSDDESSALNIMYLLDKRLPKICAPLVCNRLNVERFFKKSVIDRVSLFSIFIVDKFTNFDECLKQATKNTTSMGIKVFTIDFYVMTNPIYPIAAFAINESSAALNDEDFLFSVHLHLVENPIIKRCCSQGNYTIQTSGFYLYLFCYGSTEFCQSSDGKLWASESTTLVSSVVALLNEEVTHQDINIESNPVLGYLIYRNIQVSLSQYQRISKLSFVEHDFETSYNWLVFSYVNLKLSDRNDTDILLSSELGFSCVQATYYTICKRDLYSDAYYIFAYDCFLTPSGAKAIPLIYFYDFDTSIDMDNYCKNETAVVLVDVAGQNIASGNLHFNETYIDCPDHGVAKKEDSTNECYDIRYGYSLLGKQNFFVVYPSYLSTKSVIELVLKGNVTETNIKNQDKLLFTFLELKEDGFNFNMENDVHERDNSEESQKSLEETVKILTKALITNNTDCLEDISTDRFSIYIDASNDLLRYRVGPIPSEVTDVPCLSMIPEDIYTHLKHSNSTGKLTVNKFWPTCFYNYLIVWDADKDSPLIKDWDYLSDKCKRQETALFVIMFIVTVVTILGNVLTLLILFVSGLVKQDYFMLLTNLSLADLLLGLTSASQAIYDTYRLRTGDLTIYDLDSEGTFSKFTSLISKQPKGFQQLRFERYEWSIACSIIMNISVQVSLLLIVLLSIARLLMFNGRPIKSKILKIAIGFIWVYGIFFSIIVNYRKEGWRFVGYFDPITKLTINIGSGNDASVSAIFTYIQITVGVIAGIIMVAVTVCSVVVYYRNEQKKVGNMNIHHGMRDKQWHKVTQLLLVVVTIFAFSSFAIILDISLNVAQRSPIAHFILWWVFMAGASWNWVLYCFTGTRFRTEVKTLFLAFISKLRGLQLK